VLLLLFVFCFGPTIFIINTLLVSISGYIQNILPMSLALSPFENDPWIGTWTIFYWAWWLSWGPFVGTFIARISKGRTVKEFILGVIILPAFFSCIWFTVFGGTALYFEIFEGVDIVAQVTNDVTVGLFTTLSYLPMGKIISFIATVLIITFFVTSADSATFVIGMFSRNGDLNPDTKIKIIWGLILSLMSIVLLFSGGLVAMRNTSIIMALPFLLIIILMCVAVYKAFGSEKND
jgi:glycine betaine transporter